MSDPSTDVRLDALTRDVLDFERAWRRGGRSKPRSIRERFDITPTRYHQLLVRAIDAPEALVYDPVLVRRLRRLREARRITRGARRLGHPVAHG